MEDRLLKLLDTEQLSSSKFADVIGVQRSSVSHILTGRNKPSFDFLQKTLKEFPLLNADWLILGEGEMYEGERGPGGGSLFDMPTPVSGQKGTDSPLRNLEQAPEADSSTRSGSHISDSSQSGHENTAGAGGSAPQSATQQSFSQQSASFPPAAEQFASQRTPLQQQPDQQVSFRQGSVQQSADQQDMIEPKSAGSSLSQKRVRRVILFYDDNSFDAYDQA